tara:strand:- start:18 stop:158 length:141 start_codon:yes stop_codon:yes gene_type:complete
MLTIWHVIDVPPRVTEAVLTKFALLAHTLGAGSGEGGGKGGDDDDS